MTDPAAHSAELSPLKRALLALDKMQTRIEALEGEKREPIAVLGIGCRFPGGVDSVASFWRLLDEGRDAVGSCPADRPGARIWEEAPFDAATAQLIRQGGFLRDVDQFDPGFFSISPREAARMDPQQRLLLQVACEALESAGLPLERIAGTKAGVFVGIHSQSSDYYLLQTAAPEEMDTYTSTGCAHSIVANRLSYTLDLRGPSVAVDTACSSSLVALHLACQSLRSRESDLALAGGVNLILAPETSFAFSRLEFLSAAGRCKTFDASANGFVRAEGCGVVALKRLSEALRDGDPVLAIIRGTALNQDGATNGLTAPNGLSQQSVIRAALENARVDPAQVTLIETHGTGTLLGDPIEVDALRAVFPPAGRRALGAVKTNIGHAEAAAGIAGVIKCVLALQHGKIPRNLHFKSLNPHIDLSGSEFFIPVETVPWESPSGPRCASVSSFGFGGTNGHVILQEAPVRSLLPQDAAPTPPTAVLLPLSARSVEALRALVSRWREFLERAAESLPPFSDIVSTAALRRSHHARRLALVGRDTEELSRKLAEIERNGVPTGVAQGREPDTAGRVAFVFSGQGPQWWAMGRELLATEAAYRSELERIDSLIQARVRFSILAELAKDESQSQLQRTDIAQPALFALQMGLVALWKSWGVEPEAAIGHSVGEVAAACTAGALTLEDAVTVVCHRGRLMHRPSGRGRMVAVEMPVAEARELVASYDGRVGIAAINTPESLTLSGEELAVNEMVAALERLGVNCRLLKVDYAFHSPAMDAVKPELRDALRGIKPSSPSVLLVSTVTGALAQAGDYGPDYWAQNIRQPVQFGAGVDLLIREGFNLFVEAAPHPVLSASVEQRLEAAGMRGGVLSSLRRGRPERETMLTALGALYVSGHPIAWNSLYRAPRQVVELPPYPWQQKSYWLKTSAPTRARLAPTPATEVPDDWYYDVAWEERPRVDAVLSRGIGHHLTEPSEAARRLHPHAAALADAAGFAASRAAQAEVEKLATQFMADALERLGFDFAPGRTFSAEGLRAELGVQVRHSRLFARMLEVLAEENLFARRGGDWQVVARKPALPTVPSAAAHGAEAALLVRCGGQLANVLRGEVDPLQLLFPDGDAPGAESIYRDSPSARFYNQFVAQIVRECVLRVPRGGTVRLLEVGAGTGGTTTQVLEKLSGVRVRYTFTDVARTLVNDAQKRFASRDDFQYAVFDAERSPSDQGFADGSFDVILAANVVHATADLRTTLSHLRRLLTPGGILVLLETTARRRWVDLTFGLTEGWWRFTDTPLRPEHALLTPHQWCALLDELGFLTPTAVAAEHSVGALHEQAILVARGGAPTVQTASPGPAPSAAGRWLLLADQRGLAASLAEQLRRGGAECVVANAIEDDGSSAWWDELLGDNRPWRGIIHAWSLDATMDESNALPGLAEAEGLCCRSILRLVQALARAGQQLPPKLWLLTRGAQTAWPRLDLEALAQAPVWGFGRTIAIEHPELWGGLIDVDRDGDLSLLAQRIAAEICTPDGEDEIALGEEVRLVPRLVAVKPPASAQLVFRPDATYLITGGLGGLGPRIARWLIDQGARHLVLCGRRTMPDRAVWTSVSPEHEAYERVKTVLKLERQGAAVTVVSVDVSDRARMQELFATLREQTPALAGIIHAAADIKFSALTEMSAEALQATLRPKVQGTWLLHELSRNLPLDFFALFSSATTLFGASRIAHYAASNQALDFLAHWRRSAGLPALSVDWGAWEEIRLLGEHHDEVERFGLRPMPADRALQAMSRLAASRVAQRTVADVDWPLLKQAFETRGRHRFFERIASQASPAAAAVAESPVSWKALLETSAPEDRNEVLAGLVADEVRRVLELDSREPLDPVRGLFEMGMDSLMSVRLKTRLAHATGATLPATLTFTYPTVTALTQYLLREIFGVTPLAQAVPKTQPHIKTSPSLSPVTAADDLQALSDEQVKDLLSDELDSLSAHLRE